MSFMINLEPYDTNAFINEKSIFKKIYQSYILYYESLIK